VPAEGDLAELVKQTRNVVMAYLEIRDLVEEPPIDLGRLEMTLRRGLAAARSSRAITVRAWGSRPVERQLEHLYIKSDRHSHVDVQRFAAAR